MGMIALKCPSCGADIQLDGSREFGFCNYCGTKVMQDKIVVEHQGSLKIDNSELLNNYLIMAENALKASNGQEAQEYINKVLEIEPQNSYAWLLKMKTVEYSATIGDSKLTETSNYGENAIKFASEKDKANTEHEVYMYYLNRANTIMLIALSKLSDTAKLKELAGISMSGVAKGDVSRDLYFNLTTQALLYKQSVPTEYIKTHEDIQNSVATLAKLYGSVCEADAKRLEIYGSKLLESAIEARKKILISFKEGLPEEKAKEITNEKVSTNSNNGCYVATAIYGSYDCPQVWTLRRYRDNQLASTWYGRAFIHTYYTISPTIVKLFGDKKWFKHMWKGKLDRMVMRLNDEGVENTPYNDKEW